MIVLSYLWVLAVVPLLLEKDDSQIQWHAKHGLVLMVAEIIFWIAFTVVVSVLSFVTFGLLSVIGLLSSFVWLAIIPCRGDRQRAERPTVDHSRYQRVHEATLTWKRRPNPEFVVRQAHHERS